MTQTPILRLNKPHLGDSPPDITQISGNLPIIDEALYSATQKLSNLTVNKFHKIKDKRTVSPNYDLSGFDLNPYYMYRLGSRKFTSDYTDDSNFYIETDFDMTSETSAMFTDDTSVYSMTANDTINIDYVLPSHNALFDFTWQIKLTSGTANAQLFYKKYDGNTFVSLGTIAMTAKTNTVYTEYFANMDNLGGASKIRLQIKATSNVEIERIKVTNFQIYAYSSVDLKFVYPESVDLNVTEDEPIYVYNTDIPWESLYRGDMSNTLAEKQIDRKLEIGKYYILINKGSYWTATEV